MTRRWLASVEQVGDGLLLLGYRVTPGTRTKHGRPLEVVAVGQPNQPELPS